ncbi:hypothetical protein KY290_013711 [Solanum tuberosum]|uniref:Uncharacterized protein n=1 Tax=Solanum tuberosum TaxID=4113 RepID=A0ABQ7VN61_SOLTU|nr:hypothetical protein KY289_013825 [Solanum tuberosum]KAH0769730.1 hypothetical protein KY290_013711 [Solanum tuberosum]
MEEIRMIEGCKPSSDFTKLAPKCGDVKRAGLPKKFLKGEYQLLFEFINKVLVPRTEKRTVASVADLFLMEKLDELEGINLSAIMLEHMHRVPPSICSLQPPCWNMSVSKGRQKADHRWQMFWSSKPLLNVMMWYLKVDEQVVQQLKDENAMMMKTNASLNEEVKALNKQLIQAHKNANERMLLLMCTLNPHPPPS